MPRVYIDDPDRFFLGDLCKNGHDWQGSGQSRRRVTTGRCECCILERSEQTRARARERMAAKRSTPEGRAAATAATLKHRAFHGRPSRSKTGLPFGFFQQYAFPLKWADLVARLYHDGLCPVGIADMIELHKYLQAFKPSLTVAACVADSQRQYCVSVSPEVKRKMSRQREADRYASDPEYRLYHRQKSKRRKALMRGSVGIQLTGRQVRARFAEFGHCCAYCGATGRLHIEHVIPISKGGTHALGNVVPACEPCNYSKRACEVEAWYRAQPFFSEARWRKIKQALGWDRGSVGQLALL